MTTSLSKRSYLRAAFICILYIVIQCFQEYVFQTVPQPQNIEEELNQGFHTLHLIRSALLLSIFFVLVYVYAVVVYCDFNNNRLMYSLAFIAMLFFCLLEIGLRSIEFFYIQIDLVWNYMLSKGQEGKKIALQNFNLFKSVQRSLYFPLLISQLIGSIIIARLFPIKPKVNTLIKLAFGLNACRLLLRVGEMFFYMKFLDHINGILYLPLAFIIYGSIAIWLFNKTQQPMYNTEN